jgi:biotin carboxyl carrier protein
VSKSEFIFDGELVESSFEQSGDVFTVVVGDKTVELLPFGQNLYLATLNGRRHIAAVARDKGQYYIDIDSVLLEVKEPSEDGVAGAGGDQSEAKDKIFAPMPGKVVKIMVKEGDEVHDKQPLVIVEAMKMENPVQARTRGKVKAVNFAVGDQVDTESPIIELELESNGE